MTRSATTKPTLKRTFVIGRKGSKSSAAVAVATRGPRRREQSASAPTAVR
eukprot:SAG11_NODE_2327_length_3516_cov_2.408838_6_plen_50_part_00